MSKLLERIVSLALAVCIIVSSVPMNVFAEEVHDHSAEIIAETKAEEISEYITEIVELTGVTSDMSDDDIVEAIFAMSDDDFDTLMEKMDAVETKGAYLTEEGYNAVMAEENTELYGRLYNVLTTANVNFFASKTVTVLDGKVSVTDDNGTGSVSDGTVTITAKGSMFSKKTHNITIAINIENIFFIFHSPYPKVTFQPFR